MTSFAAAIVVGSEAFGAVRGEAASVARSPSAIASDVALPLDSLSARKEIVAPPMSAAASASVHRGAVVDGESALVRVGARMTLRRAPVGAVLSPESGTDRGPARASAARLSASTFKRNWRLSKSSATTRTGFAETVDVIDGVGVTEGVVEIVGVCDAVFDGVGVDEVVMLGVGVFEAVTVADDVADVDPVAVRDTRGVRLTHSVDVTVPDNDVDVVCVADCRGVPLAVLESVIDAVALTVVDCVGLVVLVPRTTL